MALGYNSKRMSGAPSGNRSLESWQVEENADKFGNVDAIAAGYQRAGLEHIEIAEAHEYGENYVESYFLDIDDERFKVQDGFSQHQVSFDLVDLVRSTGAAKK